MKVGDLVKYTEKTCWGYSVRSSIDIVEWQKKIAGFGIMMVEPRTQLLCGGRNLANLGSQLKG